MTARLRTTLLVSGAAGALLLTLLLDVQAHGRVSAEDAGLHADVLDLRRPWLTTVAKAVTTVGSSPVMYTLLVVVLLVLRRRRGEVLVAAVALLTGQAVRRVLNLAVGRPRPARQDWLVTVDGHAWPSGHAATSVLALGLLVALLWPGLGTAARRVAVAAAAVLALAIGLSRVYLGVHWPTDVVGGWLFGVVWLSWSVLVLVALRAQRTRGTLR